MKKIGFWEFLLSFVFAHSFLQVNAQCTQQVTHLSGSQQVGCTQVTVTSDGSVSTLIECPANPKQPYWAGRFSSGSYIFTFSPPISGVTIDLFGLNNTSANSEEMRFEINGSFSPIISPGVPDGCLQPAEISGTGTIIACSECLGSWDAVNINTPITTLKVEDLWLNGTPSGVVFSLFICCSSCQTDAGTITASALNLCGGQQATVPASSGVVLDNNDILRYILFSNPNDTLGSIIVTNTTPTFSFNPATMQTGVTYYIAAIAGNNLNGNVDLNDPCLDISNAIPVVWWPLPTVTFSTANPNVCAGACTTVTATFTGTAPFTLTYTTPTSGTVTQTFPGNTGTFQVCTLPGSPPGNLVVQATSVVDSNCTCE